MAPHPSFRVGVSSVVIRVKSSLNLWMAVALSLTLLVANGNTYEQGKDSRCPCSDPSLCLPVNVTRDKEIIVFSLDGPNWHHYDWDHITTVVDYHKPLDAALMCYAHSKGVRVIEAGSFSKGTMANETLRKEWVEAQVTSARDNFLDGINLDVELTLTKEDAPLVTTMVQLTTDAFRKAIPTSKVSFDAPFAATSGNRPYEYAKIAGILDYIIIMAYDMPFAEGVVGVANSRDPYSRMARGVQTFLSIGIPSSKLALGVPWYGYDFSCTSFSQNICYISQDDWSDGMPALRDSSQIKYNNIMDLIRQNSTTEPAWNSTCMSVYISYKDKTSGTMHQIWYDTPESLSLRYYYAKAIDLLGVAMWTADCLDYSDDPVAKQQTKAMWDAIAMFV